MAHHRVYSDIAGNGDAYAELISSGAKSFQGGQSWKGDADLTLFEAPTEELARLEVEVEEIIGGYDRQVGVEWNGGHTLARLTRVTCVGDHGDPATDASRAWAQVPFEASTRLSTTCHLQRPCGRGPHAP